MSNSSNLEIEYLMSQGNKDYPGGMRLSPAVVERVCKKMIKVILYCLPNATKGTIYSVSPIPELRVVRIASGHRNGRTDEITWEGGNRSDYNPPGQAWKDYRDRPGKILEAMGWCVERQKSWTSDEPEHNIRSVRKQLEGRAWADYHHMEPVLIKKTDLWDMMPPASIYPSNSQGDPIWQDSQYATVAVIRINFLPKIIRRGDRSTRVITELSQSLGTEMLSLHTTEIALENEIRLVEERQETVDILAHDFRNIIAGLGFAYRAVNNEISYLRESWENLVQQCLPDLPSKQKIVEDLNKLLTNMVANQDCLKGSNAIAKLIRYQEQLLESCLLPEQNEFFLKKKIRPLWQATLSKVEVGSTVMAKIEELLDTLRESFHVSASSQVVDKINHLPKRIKQEWVELAYKEINGITNALLKRYIELLDNKELEIPHQNYSQKNLISLKGLIELAPVVERRLNTSLEMLKRDNHSPFLP